MWDTTVCAAERKARLGFSRWDQARSDAVFFVDFQRFAVIFHAVKPLDRRCTLGRVLPDDLLVFQHPNHFVVPSERRLVRSKQATYVLIT
ncbi:hypothetical protein L596_004247 [Steinernema carpocapsae]|uniref:Uncharacterized protein n=1 Tax=Steinernema carpocapsae TaxID=34508 RepID=A0A4U8UV47_STECR|nr:hypothetical protein L596_004247 [Steinernema carpocapsae]